MTLYNLSILIFVPQNGFLAAFKRLDGTMDCCSNNSLTDLCFSYVKRHTSEREVSRTLTPLHSHPSNSASCREFQLHFRQQYACMPVRKMVTGTQVCRSDRDCDADGGPGVCVTPSLQNQTRFIRVAHPPEAHMLFVGYPPHLQHAGMKFPCVISVFNLGHTVTVCANDKQTGYII